MADPDSTDPLIRQLREQLSDNDVAIVEAVNARLKLVARLKRVKEERGIDFLDPAREEWMLQYLTRANRGPLSADGLREIYTELLDLTKREVTRGEESLALVRVGSELVGRDGVEEGAELLRIEVGEWGRAGAALVL